MSAQGVSILPLSVRATADIGEGRPIGFDGAPVVDSTTKVLGVTERPAKAGEWVAACALGTQPAVIKDAGLAAGTALGATPTGLTTYTTGVIVGYLLQASTVAGGLSEILIK